MVGGSGWESNPPLRGSARSRTALKAAQVTRPESLPRGRTRTTQADGERKPGGSGDLSFQHLFTIYVELTRLLLVRVSQKADTTPGPVEPARAPRVAPTQGVGPADRAL